MNQTSNTAPPSSRTYWNLAGEVIPAPRPVFHPTKEKPKPGRDDFVVVDLRKLRRDRDAADRRALKKGRRNFKRRELAKEREAGDLAQFFNLAKGLVPASSWRMKFRANQAINRRIRRIVDADRARYDSELEARRKDRDLPAPQPPVRHEVVRAQLESIALSAPTRVPKVKRQTETPIGFTVEDYHRARRIQ